VVLEVNIYKVEVEPEVVMALQEELMELPELMETLRYLDLVEEEEEQTITYLHQQLNLVVMVVMEDL
jgi:hypothetical protein